MNALLRQLRQLGVRVSLRDDRIAFDAPKGSVPPALRAKLLSHKPELIRELRAEAGRLHLGHAEAERAAILEFDAHVSRVDADRAVREGATSAVARVLGNRLVAAAEHLLSASVVEVRLPDGAIWKAPSNCIEPGEPRTPVRSGAGTTVRACAVKGTPSPGAGDNQKRASSRSCGMTGREKTARWKSQRQTERATVVSLRRHLATVEGHKP
jgi:hypothetical protein